MEKEVYFICIKDHKRLDQHTYYNNDKTTIKVGWIGQLEIGQKGKVNMWCPEDPNEDMPGDFTYYEYGSEAIMKKYWIKNNIKSIRQQKIKKINSK